MGRWLGGSGFAISSPVRSITKALDWSEFGIIEEWLFLRRFGEGEVRSNVLLFPHFGPSLFGLGQHIVHIEEDDDRDLIGIAKAKRYQSEFFSESPIRTKGRLI